MKSVEAFLEHYMAMEQPGSRAAPAAVEHGVGYWVGERETRRLSLSFLRYEGTEMRDGMGAVTMGWAAREQDDECWPQQRACL